MWYVQKFEIPIEREFRLDLPSDSAFLGVMLETVRRGTIEHIPYLYIRTYSRTSPTWRPRFLLLKTTEEATDAFIYIGSFQLQRETQNNQDFNVYHLFREAEPPAKQPTRLADTVT
jgi:hypothetical protein